MTIRNIGKWHRQSGYILRGIDSNTGNEVRTEGDSYYILMCSVIVIYI